LGNERADLLRSPLPRPYSGADPHPPAIAVLTLYTTSPQKAAAHLRMGQVVAFPTETVYGLGADAFNAAAVQRIFEAKGRPSDNPLIVHLAEVSQIDTVAAHVPADAHALLDRFSPGPLTVILPKAEMVPAIVSGGLTTVGVRIPGHPLAQAFLRACNTPVAAPSANRSGRPSPTSWQAVASELDGRIGVLLKGGRAAVGLESTVVDCSTSNPVVLRAGAVTVEELRQICPTIQVADSRGPIRSPGQKHRHYTPAATVVLVSDPAEATPAPVHAYIGLDAPDDVDAFGHVCVCSDLQSYAHHLFDFFYHCDAAGMAQLYCQRVPETGLGRALMDRLKRAATR